MSKPEHAENSQGGAVPDATPSPANEPLELTVANHPLFSKIIRFSDIARCGDEVWIEHKGQIYRLRTTRQGKLLLSK